MVLLFTIRTIEENHIERFMALQEAEEKQFRSISKFCVGIVGEDLEWLNIPAVGTSWPLVMRESIRHSL